MKNIIIFFGILGAFLYGYHFAARGGTELVDKLVLGEAIPLRSSESLSSFVDEAKRQVAAEENLSKMAEYLDDVAGFLNDITDNNFNKVEHSYQEAKASIDKAVKGADKQSVAVYIGLKKKLEHIRSMLSTMQPKADSGNSTE